MKIVRLEAENLKRLRAVEIEPDGNVVVIAGRNGQGKQQPVSEPVLTPRGWVTMGELRVGDFVMGSDGEPTHVTGIYPQTERRTFAVRFVDGGVVRCGPEHLWTVYRLKSLKPGSPGHRAAGKSSTLVSETLTTQQIIDRGVLGGDGRHRKFSVSLPQPLRFADAGRNLPVDAYSLGVILGDGHIERSGYVTVTSHDPEIFDWLKVDGWRSADGTELASAEWSRPLVHMGLGGRLAWEKFIPPEYLLASVEDRWALLCGLMDTDGTAAESWAEFVSTSERLARDVADLALSLGCLASVRACGPKTYRYNGKLKQGRDAWLVRVKSAVPPFRLARKHSKWKVAVLRPIPRRFIVAIDEVEPEDSVCIQVEADDGLYVTNDYVLTHNTSVLDAIWFALGGGAALKGTARPIRDGAEHASVVLDLGDIRVTRTWSGENTALKVESADGARYGSPQQLLDGLVGRLSFDPLAFAQQDEKTQLETLLGLVELPFDPAALDGQRRALYEDRTIIGREVKTLEGHLAGIEPVDGDVPDEPLALADVMRQIQEAQKVVVNDMTVRKHQADAVEKVAEARRAFAAAKVELDAATAAVEALPALPDLDALQEQGESFAEINDKITAKKSRAQVETALEVKLAHYELHTEKIAQLDQEKADAVAAAKMPIDGLGFTDDGVTYQGVPFKQSSAAEQLRVSVAMAMALNPQIRVVRITDGSLLDSTNLALIEEMCRENDMQCWIERVSEDGDVGVLIEDGMVAAINGKPVEQLSDEEIVARQEAANDGFIDNYDPAIDAPGADDYLSDVPS